jgi:hypothetical protein
VLRLNHLESLLKTASLKLRERTGREIVGEKFIWKLQRKANEVYPQSKRL